MIDGSAKVSANEDEIGLSVVTAGFGGAAAAAVVPAATAATASAAARNLLGGTGGVLSRNWINL
jgi:hypothetical protein